MSVLFSPAVGYPDDQQQPQWQSQVLLDRTDTIGALGSLAYPLIQCSNWKCTTINYQSGGAQSQLLLQWFSDKAMSIQLGSKIVVVDTALFCNVTIPNQGPYLLITATTYTSPATVTMILSETNRDGIPWYPQSMLPVIDVQGVSLAGGASQDFSAGYTYAGPATAAAIRDSSGFQYSLTGLELSGTVHNLINWDTSTGTPAVNQYQHVILPPLRLKLHIKNEAGTTQTFSFSLTPDLFH